MGELFRVAIHHDNDCGYIEYDPASREIQVVLDDSSKRKEIEAYLSRKQGIRVARTLLDFTESVGFPAESLDSMKVVLTHLWEHTGVFVDWSRPVTTR